MATPWVGLIFFYVFVWVPIHDALLSLHRSPPHATTLLLFSLLGHVKWSVARVTVHHGFCRKSQKTANSASSE